MTLVFRHATPADIAPITAIAAQVWEGEDYIATVIEEWLADSTGAVIVADLDGTVAGYGHRVQLLPGYLWLEGLRVDPAFRGRGIAKALTASLLETARLPRQSRVALSTYLDNQAAIAVIEAAGFQRVAGFVYAEAGAESPARAYAALSSQVQTVDMAAAVDFILNSAAFNTSGGFFPHGWRFFPFALAPEAVLARMQWILGLRRGGGIIALLCSGCAMRHQQEFTVDFLDGEPEAVGILLRHALALARDARTIEMMLPYAATEPLPALPLATHLGFELWYAGAPDAFVYQLG